MLQVYDHFLESYADLKNYTRECDFKDEVNPKDGVTYPYICKDIPESVSHEVFDKLGQFKGSALIEPVLFLRMSPKDVQVPHIAHTDAVMGQYSFMLYLNEKQGSGTTFLRHIMTGIAYQPVLESFIDIVNADMNKKLAWAPYQHIESAENRAVIFDANCIHCAQPIGGFGQDQTDARIVLTGFFS